MLELQNMLELQSTKYKKCYMLKHENAADLQP